MYYQEIEAKIVFKSTTSRLKKYLSPSLDESSRALFVKQALQKELQANDYKSLGVLCRVKDFKINKIRIDSLDQEILQVDCFIKAYYYKLLVGQIVNIKVEKIYNSYLEGHIVNMPQIKIGLSTNQLSVNKIEYLAASRSYLIGDSVKVKEGGLLRAKILSYQKANSNAKDFGPRLKVTCKSKGLGII